MCLNCVVSHQVTADLKMGCGFTAGGGERREGADQAASFSLRHIAHDAGDLLAAVCGDCLHELLPARSQFGHQFAPGMGDSRRLQRGKQGLPGSGAAPATSWRSNR